MARAVVSGDLTKPSMLRGGIFIIIIQSKEIRWGAQCFFVDIRIDNFIKSHMANPYLPNPNASGVARIFRGAHDLPLLRDDQHVFPPDDNWTLALAEAIVREVEAGELDGKKILEMGCGSGINIAGICALGHFFRNPPSLLALDITSESIRLCEKMAQTHKFEGIKFYQSNLLQDVSVEDIRGTEVVLACLPQVLWDFEANDGQPPEPRQMADYYVPPANDIRPEDAYGLGLLARALDQIRDKIDGASVLFNIAGRQGDHVEKLFIDHGFPQMTKVVDRIIPNDPGTSLISFAKWEQESGETCRFYGDPEGQEVISATEAEERRVEGEEVHHDLFVMKAEIG